MTNSYMNSSPIEGATRELAVDQDEYINLQIRDETMDDGTNVMVSRWKPTSEQLAHLNGGGSFYLGIMGDIHPPVLICTAILEEPD